MGRVLNSGPAPDPNAIRRNRPSDAASWTTLPATGLQGDIPDWPDVIEDPPTMQELALWQQLWRQQPQAHIWKSHGLELAVATYVRTALYAASIGAKATYLTAVRQQSEGLLLTPAALRSSRYRVLTEAEAAPQDPDSAPAPVLSIVPATEPKGSSVLGRLGGASASGPQAGDEAVDDEYDDEDGDEVEESDD